MSASNRSRVIFEKGWNLEGQKGGGGSGDAYQSTASQHKVMTCVRQGCEVALSTGGPLLRSRVLGVGVRIRRVGQLSSATSADTTVMGADLARLQVPLASQNFASFAALLRSTVMKAQSKALAGLPEWKVMEPVMAVEIQIPLDGDSGSQDASLAPFLGELARRRGEVETVEMAECDGHRGGKCCLRAFAPLAELSGFSAAVRSLSSGRAEIVLRFAHFQPVSTERQIELLRHVPSRPLAPTHSSA
nr:translation elongation factor G [Echinococcus granulosus]